MGEINIGALRSVSGRLDAVRLSYAFTGGAVVNLLLDHPDLSPARPTDDVDVIVELASDERYSSIETKLRESGFEHDMSEGAPKCRWRLGLLVVDIMPTRGEGIGLNTKWFDEVLSEAQPINYAGTTLRVVSPVGLLVLKYLTFCERGEHDYYASHDLEDFITVIDGRAGIVGEIDAASAEFRLYLIRAVGDLLGESDFREALGGHLPADSTSQLRLSGLRSKLNAIAALERGR